MNTERNLSFSGNLPDKSQLVMALLAEQLQADMDLGSSFEKGFTPTPAQQHMYDCISNSQVDPAMWLHLLVFGDTGGGKSWAVIAHVIRMSLLHAGCRSIFIRETKGDLMLTTFSEILEFFDRWDIVPTQINRTLGVIRLSNGSEMHFRSDKSLTKGIGKDKADSLGSSKFSLAVFEEVDSTSKETYNTMSGRMRHYLPGLRNCIFGICNPTSPTHWIQMKYNYGDRQLPPLSLRRWIILHMMAKDNPYMKGGYDKAKLEDWEDDPAYTRRMGHGLLGPETKGTPVFHRSFSRERHVSHKDLRSAINPAIPIWRGWDFGYNSPACVIFQDDPVRGQIRVLWSICGHNMSTWLFVQKVKNQLMDELPLSAPFHAIRWKDACDPQGKVKNSSGSSDLDQMVAHGINPMFRRSFISEGVDIIEQQLLSNCYQGQPSMIFDKRAEALIDAMESGYCIKDGSTSATYETTKDGTYDHIVDAYRYPILFVREAGHTYDPWEKPPGQAEGWGSILTQDQSKTYYDDAGAYPSSPQHIRGGPSPRNSTTLFSQRRTY